MKYVYQLWTKIFGVKTTHSWSFACGLTVTRHFRDFEDAPVQQLIEEFDAKQ